MLAASESLRRRSLAALPADCRGAENAGPIELGKMAYGVSSVMNRGPQELVMPRAKNSPVGIRAKQFAVAEGAHAVSLCRKNNAGHPDQQSCLNIGVLPYQRAAFLTVEPLHAPARDSRTAGRLCAQEARPLPELLLFGLKPLLSQTSADVDRRGGLELFRNLLHALPGDAVEDRFRRRRVEFAIEHEERVTVHQRQRLQERAAGTQRMALDRIGDGTAAIFVAEVAPVPVAVSPE